MTQAARYPGWRIVGVLAVTQFVGYGCLFYSYAVLLTPMRADLHLSLAQANSAYSLMLLVMGVAAVPVGRVVDARGGRVPLVVGSVLAVVGLLLWSAAHSLAALLGAFAVLGLAGSLTLYQVAFPVLLEWFHERKDTALLAVTMVAGLASTAFFPVTQQLVHAFGWRGALVALAVLLGVVTIPLHAFAIRSAPDRLGMHPDGALSPPAPLPGIGQGVTLARAVRSRAFLALVVALFANTATIIVIATQLVAYLLDRGLTASTASTLAAGVGLLSVTGRLVVTRLGARMAMTGILATVSAVQALSVALLAIPGDAAVVAFVLLFGLGFGVSTIAQPVIVAEVFGRTAFGSINGAITGATTLARVAAPVGVGLLRAATGSWATTLVLLAAACAVCSAAVLLVRPLPESVSAPSGGRTGA